jgi:hypothetical protein
MFKLPPSTIGISLPLRQIAAKNLPQQSLDMGPLGILHR